jgi:hypothetical protein
VTGGKPALTIMVLKKVSLIGAGDRGDIGQSQRDIGA